MILIWDNGAEYSYHHISFLDIGEIPPDEVEALLRDGELSFPDDGFIVAVAERLDWRSSRGIKTVTHEGLWAEVDRTIDTLVAILNGDPPGADEYRTRIAGLRARQAERRARLVSR